MKRSVPAHGNAARARVRVMTYGTFDVLHIGHINLLRRAKALGDYLIVGISTDKFNALKHKDALQSFAERKAIVEALRFVDKVIPEREWKQKKSDVKKYHIDVLAMGDDWKGEFDWLKKYCSVVYLPRTKHISSTKLRRDAATRHIWRP
jgi:glycerol-3-phosphate cytidylyltransferase